MEETHIVTTVSNMIKFQNILESYIIVPILFSLLALILVLVIRKCLYQVEFEWILHSLNYRYDNLWIKEIKLSKLYKPKVEESFLNFYHICFLA